MPTGGVLVVMALGAIGFVYVGQPVARASKKVGREVCHVATFGTKCKPKKPQMAPLPPCPISGCPAKPTAYEAPVNVTRFWDDGAKLW